MARKKVKTVTNTPEEFIPESHKDLDKSAKEIHNCPMIFTGVRTNRDQQWAVQDEMELKDPANPEKGVKGMGKGFKYLWENIILKVQNVSEVGDCFEGEEKNKLWDTAEGMDEELIEAITYFYAKSKLDDDEVKTSV